MRIKIFLTFMLFLFFTTELWAVDQYRDLAKELEAKGVKGDVLNILNPSCKEALNFDLHKSHSFWNGLWNKNGKIVVVDFLQGTKHYTMTFLPLADGACQTSRTITAYWTMECRELVSMYKKEFPEGSIKIKEEQNIFVWISSGRGTDIYLYKVPSGCVEIFREFYIKRQRGR
jgi:hypothetical protein